ncbi:MAG: PGF-CTERM sorting domain-containing protein [Halobacteriota archaeon]|nr:PGF-CTERM sorting domain-containing protein [Halobacteriota archaeon]
MKRLFVILILAILVSSSSSGMVLAEVTNENVNCIGDIAKDGPKWSPDGSKILYISSITNEFQVWVMDADGTNKTQLTTDRNIEVSEAGWSHDGSKIVYVMHHINTNTDEEFDEIWVMDADGSNKTNLVKDDDLNVSGVGWSPDGSKILYNANYDDPLNTESKSGIWIVNCDDNSKTQILRDLYSQNPVWSPDGSKIAYESYFGIWIMDSDGGNKIELERPISNPSDKQPEWSPYGSKILFVSKRDRPDNWDIWVVDSNFRNAKSLTWKDSPDFLGVSIDDYSDPMWSPDCSKIAFTADNKTWVMDVDGDNKTQLLPEEGRTVFEKGCCYEFDWSPDGSKIAFEKRGGIYIMELGGVTTPTPTPVSTTPTPTPSPTSVPSPSATTTATATPKPSPTTASTPAPTTTQTPDEETPGFEAVFAISGLLAVAYLVRKKR